MYYHGVNPCNIKCYRICSDTSFVPRHAQVGKVINDMFDVKEDKEHRIQLCLKANQYPSYCVALGYHPTDCNHLSSGITNASHLGEKALGVQAQSPAAGSPDEYNRLVKANYLLCYDDASL